MIIAIDSGTSSVRTLAFSPDGSVLALRQKKLPIFYPQTDWVEQDAEELFRLQAETFSEVLDEVNENNEIVLVGLTNQRETTIIWERASGKPIYPAIVWQDRRTEKYCQSLRENSHVSEKVRKKTGLPIDPYFSASKIRWILENVSDARARAESGELAFGTVDSWLLWHFSGGAVHKTDASNASRTLLYDISAGNWDEELLALFNVPAALLPEVCSSADDYFVGEWKGRAVRIAAMMGDQQAAAFGQRCFSEGDLKNTYGTGCFLLVNVGATPVSNDAGLLSTVAWQINGKRTYALEGAVFNAGTIFDLLKNWGVLSNETQLDNADDLADANVFLVPAFNGLGAPYWDGSARGAIFGIDRATDARALISAGLAAVAYQTDELLNLIQNSLDTPVSTLNVDGGLTRSETLLRFQAKLSGLPITRAFTHETTALGAALMAGLGVGIYDSLSHINKVLPKGNIILPEPDDRIIGLKARWKDAVRRTRGWIT